MTRPRLLDLYCGPGGASVGYARAGFDVTGCDIRPQADYPFPLIVADALDVDLSGYDAIAASPPCQPWTRAANLGRAQRDGTLWRPHWVPRHPDLIAPTRARLVAQGVPWIMENVPGAPLRDPLMLCGSSFGLRVRRHRLFEAPFVLLGMPCDHARQGSPVGVYGRLGDRPKGWDHRDGRMAAGGVVAETVEEAQDALGVDWTADWRALTQVVPPAYTEHLGRQLLALVA